MDDAKRALHIYGIHAGNCKEKMTRRRPTPINAIKVTKTPPTILDLHLPINIPAGLFVFRVLPFNTPYPWGTTSVRLSTYKNMERHITKQKWKNGIKKVYTIIPYSRPKSYATQYI